MTSSAPGPKHSHAYRAASCAGGHVAAGLYQLGPSTALSKIALEQLTATDLFGIEILVAAVPLSWLALARGARPSRPTRACCYSGSWNRA